MAIFTKKNSKDEYWFVPNSTLSAPVEKSTATEVKAAAPKKASAAKSIAKTTKKSTDSKSATAQKASAKPSAPKSSAKQTSVKSSDAKISAKTTTAKTAMKKTATKSTQVNSKKITEKAIVKPEAKKVTAKKGSQKNTPAKKAVTKSKKDSSIVTLTAANEIPRSVYYDEEEAERISKESTAEKVEISGFAGMFEIKKSRDDRYVFNLYAANHIIIATSQIYSSAQSAKVGINSVIANAERANVEDQTLKKVTAVPFPKWEIYIDRGGQYRFRLSASNGSCICHSQGYTGKSACKNGIESIIRTVKSAKIDKSYLK